MRQQCAGEARRALFTRHVRRVLTLAALATGLWLAGEATASAEEFAPPATGSTTSPEIAEVAAPAEELLGPATSAVPSAGGRAGPRVGSAIPPAPAAVAPVAPVPVAPVVAAAAPVVRSVAVPVADVAAPVVEPIERAVSPVTRAALPLASAPNALLAPAVDAATRGVDTGPMPSQGSPEADSNRLTGDLVRRAAVDISPAAGPDAAGIDPLPVRPPTPATGGAAGARCSGAHYSDQSSADLSFAVQATTTAALASTEDARQAAGNIAVDPSFSPD